MRRIAFEPLESRRLLAVTGSISGFALLPGGAGFSGLTVQVESVDSQGNLSAVSGVGPAQTLSDGSYSIGGLAAGTYQVQIEPSAKIAVGTLTPGSAGGTAGNDEIQLTLAAGQNATDYNFAIMGAPTGQISLRMFMASTGSLSHYLSSQHSAPSVATGGSGSSPYSGSYTTGGSAAAVVSSGATITAPDSPTLKSMTVTVQNPMDGGSEQLSATTTGTTLTSNYANGVLTVSGVADVTDYDTVLKSVVYSDTATTATAGDRTLSIIVNDGTDASTAATSTINVVQGANTAPSVTTNPTNETVVAGDTAPFKATASGSPTPTVQWEVNTGSGFTNLTDGGVYSGSNTDTLTITGATQAMNGYQYEALFINAAGNVTTSTATLTVETVPSVSTNPTSQTVVAGNKATFTAAASGSPTPTVQWEVNNGGGFVNLTDGGDYSGSSTGTLTITGATAAMSGYQYEAVFTNAAGNVTTSTATLTVETAPTVSAGPTSQTVVAGGTTTFTASASGSPTPTVQWEVNTGSGFTNVTNAGVYSGSSTGTLTITGATAAMNGDQYEAVFTNAAGSVTTSAATLTIQNAPSVTTNPANQTVVAGNSTTFTAAASGSPTPTVQWQVNAGSGYTNVTDGTIYSGSSTGTLTITGATVAMNGYQYKAVFSNAAGNVATTAAALTVETGPSATTNPANQTVIAGNNATFTAAASGIPTPSVQWEVNTGSGYTKLTDGAVYSGSSTGTLTITGATLAMSGYQYEAVFSNAAGNFTTTAATLTVQTVPIVSTNPANQTAIAGSNATFTAAASGSPTPSVQWQVNTGSGYTNLTDGTVYSGSSTGTLTITAATSAMNGYQYKAVFTNAAGNISSTAATLTVESVPSVSTNPANQSVVAGNNATFTAAASGSPTPSVQWQVNTGSGYTNLTDGTVYSGSSSGTLTITGATSAMNGYQYKAVFSNAAGNAATTAATLTVETVPSVTTNPANQTAIAGNNTTFTAVASGNPTPTVQWQVNTGSGYTNLTDGTVYSGSGTGTLTITGATLAMSGYQYKAVFTNAAGNVSSTAATLTVESVPSVTTNPANQSVIAGSNATFTATAGGSPAPTVQWQVNTGSGYTNLTDGTVYSGSSTGTLKITGATFAMNGYQYQAVFANAAGNITTTAATLTVETVPAVSTQPTSATVIAGNTVTFTAAASGNPTATVQWQVNSGSGYANLVDVGVYSGSSTGTLIITGATLAMNGYEYLAVFTNVAGSATTSPATLTVQAAPAVTTSPASQTVSAGNAVTFNAVASGSPTPTVQWQSSTDGGLTFTPISGATSTTYSLTAGSSDNGYQYEAVFTNGVGTPITTPPATLAVEAANGLTVIAPPPDIAIGSPVLVAMNSTNSSPAFSVTTSNSSDPAVSGDLTTTLMPQTNYVLKVVTSLGEMDFQLLNNYTPDTVNHFVSLVDSGTYTNTSFYRIIQDFMSQGGVGSSYTGAPISTIPDELNADLRFTSSGLLALANNGVDGNSSEFFVTDPSVSNVTNPDGSISNADMGDSFLDDRYTIFGKLISGDSVRQAIAALPVTTNSSTGEDSQPVTPPQITSMTVVTTQTTNAGVFLLKALPGATGTYTVTVTDGQGTQIFTVNVAANAYDPPNPWVNPINGTDTISVPANTPTTFTAQGEPGDGSGVQVDAQLFLPVPQYPTDYVDNSYSTAVSGTFQLQVGSQTTTAINFNSTDPAGTAANMQAALDQLTGLSLTTVSPVALDSSNPGAYSFKVIFAGSEQPITYVATTTASALPVTFSNSAGTTSATQELTFTNNVPVPEATNPNLTLTSNGSGSYTLTPTAGYYGLQVLEVTAVTPVTGTFELQVGSSTTGPIDFDSADMAATAANMQAAIEKLAGLSTATVSAVFSTAAPATFSVTLPGSEAPIQYVASATALPVTFTNLASVPSAVQELTFDLLGSAWDQSTHVDPFYRAYVPVLVAPPTPQILSISAGGQVLSGSTTDNNSSSATALSFDITGVVSGATVSVYMDGGTTPIATGTVNTGATTITLTTDGKTTIPSGSHDFTVEQSLATPALTLLANWTAGPSGSPAVQYSIPANSVVSAASASTTLMIS